MRASKECCGVHSGRPLSPPLFLAGMLILDVQLLNESAAWVEHTGQVIALAQRIYRSRIDPSAVGSEVA